MRNITIKLGYANAKIFKCPKCPAPDAFSSYSSKAEDYPKCTHCGEKINLIRHVSFVDCPGHDILLATMLSGAAVMDCALLLVAGNMSCPQPQTSEHLIAVEIMKLNNIIILQNKIDIIFKDERAALKNYEEIQKFITGTRAEGSPIIPISAQLKYNVDTLCQFMVEYFPVPQRNFKDDAKMIIIRSFDINKPGEEVDNLCGGVVGGTILSGILKVGDTIEIRPGEISRDENGKNKCTPIFSEIISLKAEENELLYAVPGGLIGVGLRVDPTLTRADKLAGHVLGHPGKLPKIYGELTIQFYLLKKLLGVRADTKVKKITKLETLMITVGSTSTGGKVLNLKNDQLKLQLINPVCTETKEKVALSRRIDKKWRLIGWGEIVKGSLLS